GVLNAENAVKRVSENGGDLSSAVRYVEAIEGSNSGFYIRFTDDHGMRWSSWVNEGEVIRTPVVVFEPNSGNVVAVGANKSKRVMTKYSTDLGETWSSWETTGKFFESDPTVTVLDSGRILTV